MRIGGTDPNIGGLKLKSYCSEYSSAYNRLESYGV